MRWEKIIAEVMEGNEDIVNAAANRKMAATTPSECAVTNDNVDVQPRISTDMMYSSGNDELTPEEDQFYDAMEFSSMRFSKEEERSNLIEQKFGFSPVMSNQPEYSPAKNLAVKASVTESACPPDTVCSDSIKESLFGYPELSELRVTLPLDPNMSSKPTLNVWSFLKVYLSIANICLRLGRI
jgi:hypothetical protein